MSTETSTAPADSKAVEVARQNWGERFSNVRELSARIAMPLSPEDCVIQSMPDVSPIRWHLAHTSWFFETFLLKHWPDYSCFDDRFEFLFNSYYNSVGEQFPRSRRGLLSRPSLAEIMTYREHVDHRLGELLEQADLDAAQVSVLELGLNHEQQHQELMLTDIKHVLFCNPLYPAYDGRPEDSSSSDVLGESDWYSFDERLTEIGHSGDGFAFDNEGPRHRVWLDGFQIAKRCVTNADYLEFIRDGGYQRSELWLSLGWAAVQEHGWQAPLYWQRSQAGEWLEFTLSGNRPLHPNQPVCHLSYFEADAFARWRNCRLPTEGEWEHAVTSLPSSQQGVFADGLIRDGYCVHPQSEKAPSGLMGNVWQWTSSAYSPYPGFSAAAGALGEYNGKFMCNQYVLRGGSCATSAGHIRASYRNFFPPDARWQFSGIRLAR